MVTGIKRWLTGAIGWLTWIKGWLTGIKGRLIGIKARLTWGQRMVHRETTSDRDRDHKVSHDDVHLTHVMLNQTRSWADSAMTPRRDRLWLYIGFAPRFDTHTRTAVS